MEIFVAHSRVLKPEDSWVLRQLTDYSRQGVVPVFDLGEPGDAVSDYQLRQADGLVAEFTEPNDELARKVCLAHSMGKNILAFLPQVDDPTQYLPGIHGHEYDTHTQRYANSYTLKRSPTDPASLNIFRSSMRPLKLDTWVYWQLLQASGREDPTY